MDALTGLYTKRHFLEQAPVLVSRQRGLESPLSLLMADLDHFKQINDTHGHPVGDRALKEVARRILVTVRDSDTAYRFGGEEIVCLLPGASAPVAARVANRICREVAAVPVLFEEGRPPVPVTISIGVAALTPEMTSWESLLSAADQALYQAKADGRNCVVTFRERKAHA
jgi:diguanylate cyclase (GGDEF)-like protein